MKTLFAIVFLLISLPALATNYGNVVLTHKPSDGDRFCIQSTDWCGYLPKNAPRPEAKTQTVSFVFYTDDFFSNENSGHFGIGLNAYSEFPSGDTTKIVARGRGVIFGNVTRYPKNVPGCGPTSTNNVVTFQTWWNEGGQKNCVMGWNESVPLENGQYYYLSVSATRDNGMYVSYVLAKFVANDWLVIGRDLIYDFTPASGNTDGGIFIAEVFGNHLWTFYIWNLTEEWQ